MQWVRSLLLSGQKVDSLPETGKTHLALLVLSLGWETIQVAERRSYFVERRLQYSRVVWSWVWLAWLEWPDLELRISLRWLDQHNSAVFCEFSDWGHT